MALVEEVKTSGGYIWLHHMTAVCSQGAPSQRPLEQTRCPVCEPGSGPVPPPCCLGSLGARKRGMPDGVGDYGTSGAAWAPRQSRYPLSMLRLHYLLSDTPVSQNESGLPGASWVAVTHSPSMTFKRYALSSGVQSAQSQLHYSALFSVERWLKYWA